MNDFQCKTNWNILFNGYFLLYLKKFYGRFSELREGNSKFKRKLYPVCHHMKKKEKTQKTMKYKYKYI